MCVTRLIERLYGIQGRLVIGEAGIEPLVKLQSPAQFGIARIAFAAFDRGKSSGERLCDLCGFTMCSRKCSRGLHIANGNRGNECEEADCCRNGSECRKRVAP